MYKNSSAGFLSTIVAGAVGAILTLILVVGWANRNPAQVATLLNLNVGAVVSADNTSPVLIGQDQNVVSAVKKANPAVVSIVITKDVPVIERYYEQSPGSPLDNFFNPFGNFQIPQYRQNGTQEQEVGGGSGFIVSSDGLIVTNKHVVSDTQANYTVLLNDGKKLDANVVARDPASDIAILKVEAKDLPFLEFGSSQNIEIGQSVIAIGNALGEFRNTVSVGVISGLARSITAGDQTGQSEQLENVLQTDAAINPGNSGGPLLSLDGKVIGVNVAVALGSQNVGFALPANTVKTVVESVQKTGRIIRPYIGVRYTLITPAIKEKNRLSVDYGALVLRGETPNDLAVIPGSPADKAGIKENDIILEVDGVKLEGNKTLASVISGKSVGDSVKLKVLQQGVEKDLTLTLQEIPQ